MVTGVVVITFFISVHDGFQREGRGEKKMDNDRDRDKRDGFKIALSDHYGKGRMLWRGYISIHIHGGT